MSRILEVNDLCKSFMVKKRLLGEGDVISAINHISLGLREGEMLGIIDGSGYEKSTIARLLFHSIRPDNSTMRLCGGGYNVVHAMGQNVRTFRKNVQMVFQNPHSSPSPKMNVLQNTTSGLAANRVPRGRTCRRAYHYLDAVRMQRSFLSRYPDSLSGGQRQRVAVTQALAMEPRIILVDKPAPVLDKSVQAQILDLLRDLQEKFDISIIFASHGLSVVEYMNDHIAVLCLGEVIEYGASEELYHNLRHLYTKESLRSIPQINGDARLGTADREPPIEPPSPVRPPSGCRYHPRCPYRTKNCSKHIPAPALVGRDHTTKCHRCATQN